MMNCFCDMIDRRKVFGLIWHCQRSSSSRISDTPLAGFKLAQNLNSGFVEWSCVVVITSVIPFPLGIIQKLWFSRKKCRNELSLTSFTFRGNDLVTVTIFSTIFLYRQILNLVVHFLWLLANCCCYWNMIFLDWLPTIDLCSW